MKNKQENTTEEAFNQIFNAFYKFIYENTKTFISLYELKCKRSKREIIEHEENEPFKIFKKSHKEWEEKGKQLEIELEKTFGILMEEYNDYADLVGLS